ncbi:MAG TPA: Uma2 family endonuclease [Kofleriaceae bacterium]|nr:Uma2 family endonuclease [Kofleriaceae bacterium]
MAHPVPLVASEADLRAVPDDRIAHLVDGVIYSHARPRIPHAEVCGAIHRELSYLFNDTRRSGPGGWLFLIEAELALGHDILVPDIAAWRRERLPRAPSATQFSIAPDWVCEILSPSTEAFDRGPKRRSYARAQVPYLWYVQPESKLIEVFRKQGDFYASVADGLFTERITLEPFEAVAIELGELGEWADAKPDE